MKRLVLLLAVLLSGCATIESKNTFIACKSADVVTTAIGLNSGKFVEANPILRPFIGPHNFLPLVAFSMAMLYLIEVVNEPKATAVVNVLTCGVAAHNIGLMRVRP